jgi:vacuolar-type H+-ATPase subunit E/Vma4
LWWAACLRACVALPILAYLPVIRTFSIYSNALNVARLEKLRAEQKEVDGILGDAKAKLASITSGASYRDILVKLILQVCSIAL